MLLRAKTRFIYIYLRSEACDDKVGDAIVKHDIRITSQRMACNYLEIKTVRNVMHTSNMRGM